MTKPTTARKSYDPDDHKKAYDAYYVSRNLSDVQRTIGLSYDTVLRWKEQSYACPHGCPWHGWDDRIEEELRVLAAKATVAASGITDPVKQADAMLDALEQKDPKFLAPTPSRKEIQNALALVNTDGERLHQWKLLRAKVYFELTGIPLDYETLQGERLNGVEKILGEEVFKKGLRPTNFEQTIRTLGYVDEQIEKLESRMRGEAKGMVTVEATVKNVEKSADPLANMSPQALRSLIKLSEKLPPGGPGMKEVIAALGDANSSDEDQNTQV